MNIFNYLILTMFASITLMASTNVYAVEDLGESVDYFKVEAIDFVGLKKVEKEAILEKINVKVGEVVSNYTLRRDLEKIYSLKYFDKISAHQEVIKGKKTLVFKLKERPLVSKIEFSGNEEIDDDDLLEVIKAKEFSILDVNTLKIDVQALQKYYEEKGYYLASVSYALEKVDKENSRVVFKIKEMEKVRVKKIIFLGNKSFSTKQLRDIMETREEALMSGMTGAGNFKEFNFKTDIERLKYFYKTKGHLQVNIGSPEVTVSEDRKWVFITIKVKEGPEYTVNNITFQGDLLFGEDKIFEKMSLEKDSVYSEAKLREDIKVLTEMYQDEGYAFANVLRHLNIVPGENKVDVEFSFEKGKIAYFGKITVKGNNKTRDKVVRRELLIKEGAKYSGTNMRRSKNNVNRLGFFEPNSVIFNTSTPKGKDDVLDVEILIKERNTGQISLGAGYSTATKWFLQGSIAQKNFLGKGQELSFSLSLAADKKVYKLGFTEPYFLDTKWTAGGDIFKTSTEENKAAIFKKEGLALRVGHPVWDFTKIFFIYKLETTKTENEEDPLLDTALENGTASSITTSLIQDKRNNRVEPTNGHYLSYTVEYAGVGGSKKWQKNIGDARYFRPLWGDLILRSRFNVSKIDKVGAQDIPRSEKFTLGGSRNLRGYDPVSIGPKRTVSRTLDDGTVVVQEFNIGADFATFLTVELEHPLAREAGLKWVVFFDTGEAGDPRKIKLYSDWGFGIRWFSPIGILRFEYGYPMTAEPGQDSGRFHFDIGQLF
jgi:outer membrane protein insertion porin family